MKMLHRVLGKCDSLGGPHWLTTAGRQIQTPPPREEKRSTESTDPRHARRFRNLGRARDPECMTLEHSYSTLVLFARIAHLFGKSQNTKEYRQFIRQPPRIAHLSTGPPPIVATICASEAHLLGRCHPPLMPNSINRPKLAFILIQNYD